MKLAADLLFLAGCAALVTASWFVWPPLALALVGIVLIGVAFVIYPRRPEVQNEEPGR